MSKSIVIRLIIIALLCFILPLWLVIIAVAGYIFAEIIFEKDTELGE